MTPQEALKNVRQANRLIYAYQQRIIDLVYNLRRDLKISDVGKPVGGIKHFSEDLHEMKKPEGADYSDHSISAINRESWAWDFLPTYAFEYYLGQVLHLGKLQTGKTRVALIQISDDAVYASDCGYCNGHEVGTNKNHMMLDVTKHINAEDSHSVFVLACQYTGSGEYVKGLWNTSDERLSVFLKNEKSYEITHGENDNAFLLYRFDMAEIFTPERVEHVISVLHKIVYELAPLGWLEGNMPEL